MNVRCALVVLSLLLTPAVAAAADSSPCAGVAGAKEYAGWKDKAARSEIAKAVVNIIVEQLGVEPGEVHPTASFHDDLGTDDLDMVELVMAAEEHFEIEISDADAQCVRTVGDYSNLITRLVNAKKK